MEDPSSPTGEKIIPVLEQLRLKEEEIARLQEQMRQQQLTKEREMAELRRQLQPSQISEANIILLYTLCVIMHSSHLSFKNMYILYLVASTRKVCSILCHIDSFNI